MAVEVRSGRDTPAGPAAVISAKGNGNGQSQHSRRQNRMMVVGIGLGMASRLLQDPRFQARAITVVIGLAVLKRAAQDSQAHTLERLVAWDRRHQLPRQGTASGHRARPRPIS